MACTERAPHRCPCVHSRWRRLGWTCGCGMAPGATSALDPGVLSVPCCARVLGVCPSGRRRRMRCVSAAAVRWGSEASAARPIPRAIAEHARAHVSVSVAACQAALLSTAAGRRSGGSPGSHVVQTATVLYHSIHSVQPMPSAFRPRGYALRTPRPRSAAVDGEYRDAAEDPR